MQAEPEGIADICTLYWANTTHPDPPHVNFLILSTRQVCLAQAWNHNGAFVKTRVVNREAMHGFNDTFQIAMFYFPIDEIRQSSPETEYARSIRDAIPSASITADKKIHRICKLTIIVKTPRTQSFHHSQRIMQRRTLHQTKHFRIRRREINQYLVQKPADLGGAIAEDKISFWLGGEELVR